MARHSSTRTFVGQILVYHRHSQRKDHPDQKREDRSVLVFTILWLAPYLIMKNPFALPLPWVVYGTLLFLVSGIATAAFLLLHRSG